MKIVFSNQEVEFIKSQQLARIGTASRTGDPDVAAVGFDFDGECFYVSGGRLTKTNKYHNIMANPKASLVIDDLVSVGPWHPRMLKVRGTADLVDHNGYMGPGKYIRIKPLHKMSFGI